MSEVDISDRMEIRIPDDVYKDMMEPGKTFHRLLQPDKSGKENSQRPLACVILEKMADDCMKIIVTVKGSDDVENKPENSVKTDVQQNEVSNSSQQTEQAETESRLMQTESKDEKSQHQQTEQKTEKSQLQQTEKRELRESGFQTEVKKWSETGSQTEVKELRESGFQTEVKEYRHSGMLTEQRACVPATVQTEAAPLADTAFQTDIKELADTHCQTVVKVFAEGMAQTALSLANLRDTGCQATTRMRTGFCQAKPEMAHAGAQALAECSDGAAQTELATADCTSQTDNPQATQQVQTALSLLHMCETACQAGAEVAAVESQTPNNCVDVCESECQAQPQAQECGAQTEVSSCTVHCQTDANSTQVSETQTQPDLNNRETQTDEPQQITSPPQAPPLLPAISGSEQVVDVPLHMAAGGDMGAMDGDLILPSADIQSITPLAVLPMSQVPGADAGQPPLLPAAMAMQHALVQTDPVTIIIGDAGFLVEKLKGSAVKTEKRDREIEIEFAENGEALSQSKPRSRSGYIPGSRLAGSITSPPPLSKIAPELLQSTPVRPFNPKEVENLDQYITGSNVAQPRRGPGKRRFITDPPPPQQPPTLPPALPPPPPEPVQPPAVVEQVKRELNCPFCEELFTQSAALYKHITSAHSDKREKIHRKPVGRPLQQREVKPPRTQPPAVDSEMPPHVRESVERYRQMAIATGKIPPSETLRYKRKNAKARYFHRPSSDGYTSGEYQSPPVLEPVYRVNQVQLVGDDGQFTPSPSGRTYKRRAPRAEVEPTLFEDLPEPKRAYPRGRVRREEEEDEEGRPAQQPPQVDAYEYECPHCPERYGSASHLYNHLKRSHRAEMERQRRDELSEPGQQPPPGEPQPQQTPSDSEQAGQSAPAEQAGGEQEEAEEGEEELEEGEEEEGEVAEGQVVEEAPAAEEEEAPAEEDAEEPVDQEEEPEAEEEEEEPVEEDQEVEQETGEEESETVEQEPETVDTPSGKVGKRKRRRSVGRSGAKKQKQDTSETVTDEDGAEEEEEEQETPNEEPEVPTKKRPGRPRKSDIAAASPQQQGKKPGRPRKLKK